MLEVYHDLEEAVVAAEDRVVTEVIMEVAVEDTTAMRAVVEVETVVVAVIIPHEMTEVVSTTMRVVPSASMVLQCAQSTE